MKRTISMLFIVLLVIIIVVVFVQFKPYEYFLKNDESREEIISVITLESIIQKSELNTFQAYYNGIAKVMNKEDPSEVDFYVLYKAKVFAGFNMSELEISKNEETKKIIVSIPAIEINDVNVETGTLEYMFVNEKADRNMVSKRGYDASIEDVTRESKKESAIYDLAEENAKNIILALLNPFVEDLDETYAVVFN